MTTNSNLAGLQQSANASSLYIYAALIRNNATTPNTKLTISAGIMRDQSNTIDMNLGNFGSSAPTDTVIDSGVVGVNGIDTGVLQASKVYYVYAIADSANANPTAAIISLTSTDTGPIMPFGYNVYRLIGYIHTDVSTHFIAGNWLGLTNDRKFVYFAPQATTVTAGNETSYTGISLTVLIPNIQTSAVLLVVFTPGAASRSADIAPYGGANPQITVSGQVASVAIAGQGELAILLNAGAPSYAYKVSNAGDAVNIKVVSYGFSV